MYVLSHLHDVVAGAHLYGEQHTLVAVTLDVLVLLWIFACDVGNVLQSDDVALRIGIDNLFCHVALVVVRVVHVDGQAEIARVEASAHRGEALQSQLVEYLKRTCAILGQLVLVQIDAYLLVLQSVCAQVGYGVDVAQLVLQIVNVCVQLTIRLLLALHRYEQGRGLGYVVHGLQGNDARRQRSLEGLQPVLELAPESVLVLHVVVEFEEDDEHAVLALRVCLLLVHLLVAEDEVLQWLCHTLLHLFGSGAGINSHAGSLTNRELRHLLLRHQNQSHNAEKHEHTHEQYHDVVVAHGRLDERTLYHPIGFSCYAPLDMVAHSSILLIRLLHILISPHSFVCSPSCLQTPSACRSQ